MTFRGGCCCYCCAVSMVLRVPSWRAAAYQRAANGSCAAGRRRTPGTGDGRNSAELAERRAHRSPRRLLLLLLLLCCDWLLLLLRLLLLR